MISKLTSLQNRKRKSEFKIGIVREQSQHENDIVNCITLRHWIKISSQMLGMNFSSNTIFLTSNKIVLRDWKKNIFHLSKETSLKVILLQEIRLVPYLAQGQHSFQLDYALLHALDQGTIVKDL